MVFPCSHHQLPAHRHYAISGDEALREVLEPSLDASGGKPTREQAAYTALDSTASPASDVRNPSPHSRHHPCGRRIPLIQISLRHSGCFRADFRMVLNEPQQELSGLRDISDSRKSVSDMPSRP